MPGVARAAGGRLARGLARRACTLIPVRFGSLRRISPVSRKFGYDRGQPIDRYYIERFLGANADVIRGRVLEVGDSGYTRRFGRTRVTRSEVLNIEVGHPQTTIVGDLARADNIPSDSFD